MANPKSQQFKLTKAHISADRFGGFDKKFFDVKNQVAEINIYESIEELSLTGTIAIVDDKSLYELINFNGTERIKLEMAGLGKDTDPVFEKTFIMTNIVKQLKGNDFYSSRDAWSFVFKHWKAVIFSPITISLIILFFLLFSGFFAALSYIPYLDLNL